MGTGEAVNTTLIKQFGHSTLTNYDNCAVLCCVLLFTYWYVTNLTEITSHLGCARFDEILLTRTHRQFYHKRC